MALKNLMGMAEGRSEVQVTTRTSVVPPRTVAPTTAIDSTSEFRGKLRCKETLRIDGKLVGEIRCDKTVIIGEGALVEASIQADSVVVLGEIRGDVVAKRKITLERTARMTGDLSTPGIVIEEGASLLGQLMIGAEMKAGTAAKAEARPAEKQSAAACSAAKRPAAAQRMPSTPPPTP